ncbi:S24 family peptidase [Capnocytophaga canimorsus]|uniref:LexA family transcriptional regulator n=1 Tax=Capnocytophaga canimorsus TaxID=28188 RepID=UPI0037CE26CB
MTENQRLKYLQKILGFSSQTEFANALGIKQGSLSDIYRKKNGIGVSDSIKMILLKDYSINTDWLETGEGEMLNTPAHKETTSQERLKMMIEYLQMSTKTFAFETGFIPDTRIMEIKEGKRNFDEHIVQKVTAKFPNFKNEWILTGKGEMLIDPNQKYIPKSELALKQYPVKLAVRLVTNKAKAGWSEDFYSDEYLEDMPIVMIDSDQEYHGKYLAFEVEGDSMEPDYLDGNIVICREVQRHLWSSKLHYNDWDFVIVHNTRGIMLKEIIAHDTSKGIITCHSINPEHKDFKVNLREVSFLYNVVEVRQPGRRKRWNRVKDFLI